MESVLFFTVWGLGLKLILPILGAILAGSLCASVLRLWTQLDDQVISFVGRLAGLVLFLMVMSESYFRPVVEFAEQTWTKNAFIHP